MIFDVALLISTVLEAFVIFCIKSAYIHIHTHASIPILATAIRVLWLDQVVWPFPFRGLFDHVFYQLMEQLRSAQVDGIFGRLRFVVYIFCENIDRDFADVTISV